MSDPTSTDLVRRAHALALHGGEAGDTSSLAFDARPLMWGDVPAVLRRAARHDSPVVADRAVPDGTLYEDRDEGTVEVMRAWRAHRDRVYVAVAFRPVELADDAVRPRGPWQPLTLRRYDAAGEARRRVGQVPAGVTVGAARPAGARTAPGTPSAPVRPRTGPEHAAAADAWGYLPEPVRASAERAVPLPEDWIGDLVQHERRRMPREQHVVVLRRDAERAVVVRATRRLVPAPGATVAEHTAALARADWTVEQVVLPTARPRLLEATREVPSWM